MATPNPPGRTEKLLLLALATLVSIQMVTSALWVHLALQWALPTGYDVILHLKESLFLLDALETLATQPTLDTLARLLAQIGSIDRPTWPGLVYLVSSLFNLAWGRTPLVSTLSLQLYWPLLATFTYLAGREAQGPQAGFLAALLLIPLPGLCGWARVYNLDFPLCTALAASLFCLMRTRAFQSLPWSLGLGVVLGLGLMIKGQLAIFMAAPLLVSLLPSPQAPLLPRLAKGLAALTMALTVSALWWAPIASLVVDQLWQHTSNYQDPLAPLGEFNLPASLLLYIKGFWQEVVGLPLLPLMALGTAMGLQGRHRLLLLGAMIVPWLLFSLMAVKMSRFLLPAAIPLCLMAGMGLDRILDRIRSLSTPLGRLSARAALALPLAAGLVASLGLSTGHGAYRTLATALPLFPVTNPFLGPPPTSYHKEAAHQAVELILSHTATPTLEVVVLESPSHPLTSRELAYLLHLGRPGARAYGSLHEPDLYHARLAAAPFLLVIDTTPRPPGSGWLPLSQVSQASPGSLDAQDPTTGPAADLQALRRFRPLWSASLPGARLLLAQAGPLIHNALDTIVAVHYSRGNLERSEVGRFVANGGIQPNRAEYDLGLEDRIEAHLEVRFASAEARPVKVSVDGRTLASRALDRTTGGWDREHMEWERVGPLTLAPGLHVLAIETQGFVPHIDAFRLVSP